MSTVNSSEFVHWPLFHLTRDTVFVVPVPILFQYVGLEVLTVHGVFQSNGTVGVASAWR